MHNIDGATGGGQILRSALALSMVTGEPMRIRDIRVGRKKPGLMRQHLTAVRAAATVASAKVEGDAIGSTALTFRPGRIVPGEHEFRVGTAGSAGLVLQTILPALLTAAEPSRIGVHGGTHNSWAPPYDFLARTFLPTLARLGPELETTIHRHGFYPAGGGHFTVDVRPAKQLGPLELLTRGRDRPATARLLCAGLPEAVARSESRTLMERLGLAGRVIETVTLSRGEGPGNAIVLDAPSDEITTVFTGFGARNKRVNRVVDEAAEAYERYRATDAPVGVHLADQLLLPLAIGGGGTFRTLWPVDDHVTSHAALLREWLGVTIEIEPEAAGDAEPRVARITVTGAALPSRA